jgi:hypothetical protein
MVQAVTWSLYVFSLCTSLLTHVERTVRPRKQYQFSVRHLADLEV